MMRLLVALLIPIFLASGALAQDAPARKFFGDWMADCRDDGYCSATAYQNTNPGGGAVADHILRVGRHAQEIYWEVSFTPVALEIDGWQDLLVTVDGEAEVFSGRSEFGGYGAVNDFFLLGDKAQSVLDRMVGGTRLEVMFTDMAGSTGTATFSLRGLSAALLWIDERQRRVGSERVASTPPYGLAPTGVEQLQTPQIPADLLERVRSDPECEQFEQLANGRDFIVDSLGENTTLYVIPCFSGAYNFGSKVYVDTGYGYEQQYFADYSSRYGWMGTPFLVNVYYDPETKTLSTFNKGRGLGDCGSAGQWRWLDYAFRLETLNVKDECDHDFDQDAEMPEFPRVFTAEPLPDESAEQ